MTEETKKRLRQRFEQMLEETDQKPQYTIDELEDLLLFIRDQVTDAARQEINQEKEQPSLEQEPTDETSTSARSVVASKVCCSCCGKARAWYKGHRARSVVTLAGVLTLWRAYYYCRRCKRGTCPDDSKRRLPKDSDFTVRVQQEVACLAACLPFEQATKTLTRLCRVPVSAASAERVCLRQAGKQAEAFVQEREEQYLPHAFAPPEAAKASAPAPCVLYVAADGIQTPMQGGSWKEMKVAVVQARHRDGRVDQASRYVSHLGDSETFGKAWEALAISCGSLNALRVVVLGDGAPWLWKVATARFPRALQILDFWHALEYVAKVAREAFGEATTEAKEWLSARAEEMKQSHWTAFHACLVAVRSRAPEPVAEVIRYFGNNASRMDYARYLRLGLSIGSGIAESSCKRLVTQRLKGSGMHWSEQGAQAICSLRCLLLGGQWEAFLKFWNRQIASTSPLS